MFSLPIKFEVCSVSDHPLQRYERKATQNVQIGWFGRLGVTQGHRQCHHSIKCIWLPLRLYASIVYCFRLTANYLSSRLF